MEHDDDDDRQWNDDERFYSSERDSDDSPLLSKRTYEKKTEYHYAEYPLAKSEERERRSTLSLLMKFVLFCTAMIMFCVLLYIPVYNRASYTMCKEYPLAKSEEREKRSTLSLPMKFVLFCRAMIIFCVLLYIPVHNRASYTMCKATVAGWSQNTNRDTTLYVLPNNHTAIHEPPHICPKKDINTKNKLLLLVVVCSASENFDRRQAIRNTWGNQTKYKELYKVFNIVRERYKDYNYTYDLYNISSNSSRKRREAGISWILPKIAEKLQSNLAKAKTDSLPEEKRFDDDDDDVKNDAAEAKNDVNDEEDDILDEFGMNKEFGEKIANYDYEYSSNVMRIPSNGYEDNTNLEKVLNLLKNNKNLQKIKENLDTSNTEPDKVEFQVVFLVGLPPQRNDSTVQEQIEEEVDKYGDLIQEDFIDSYNNLTIKSIMMLKWINNRCKESARYILKIDDDMYVNMPNLITNLKNQSQHHDKLTSESGHAPDKSVEYLLMGALIKNARPVADVTNKWYSPRYMYKGRMYPKYLSGTGYVFSAPAARALYEAALNTPFFHLEDVYITGICALRASPRLSPRECALFSFSPRWSRRALCAAHARATLHAVPPHDMRAILRALRAAPTVDTCERQRLTQVRRDRLRPKTTPKRLTKQSHIH